jgi:Sulfotransferase domain
MKLDFAIIGAMKAGTTTLYYWLRKDPALRMCSRKEPHFFNSPGVFDYSSDKGARWYARLFKPGTGPAGECSTGYTKYPMDQGVPARLHAHNPDLRFIYLLRNPIDRLASHVAHNQHAWRRPAPANCTEVCLLAEHEHYLNVSRYYLQLTQFFRHFSKTQFLVLTTDELKADPNRFMRKVYSHLGVRFSETDYERGKRHLRTPARRKINPTGHERSLLQRALASDVRKLREEFPELNAYWTDDFPTTAAPTD